MYTDKDKVQANGEAFASSVYEASGQGTLLIYLWYNKCGKLYISTFETANKIRSTYIFFNPCF